MSRWRPCVRLCRVLTAPSCNLLAVPSRRTHVTSWCPNSRRDRPCPRVHNKYLWSRYFLPFCRVQFWLSLRSPGISAMSVIPAVREQRRLEDRAILNAIDLDLTPHRTRNAASRGLQQAGRKRTAHLHSFRSETWVICLVPAHFFDLLLLKGHVDSPKVKKKKKYIHIL